MSELIIECPSGLRGRVRGLKAKELNLFGDRKAARSGELFDALLRACWVETIDAGPAYDFVGAPNWDRVVQADRFYALLRIRAATYGESFEFDIQCSRRSCGEPIRWALDLSDLPTKKLPAASIEKLRVNHDFDVVVGGRAAKFRLVDGATMRKNMRALRGGESQITSALALRLSSIEGVEGRDKQTFIDDLDAGAIAELTAALDAVDGGVETTIEVECGACGAGQRVELPFDQSFWMPKKR